MRVNGLSAEQALAVLNLQRENFELEKMKIKLEQEKIKQGKSITTDQSLCESQFYFLFSRVPSIFGLSWPTDVM